MTPSPRGKSAVIELRTHRPFTQPRDFVEQGDRRPTLQRIADTLQSPRFVLFYLGFYSGCLATVGLAFCWSVLS